MKRQWEPEELIEHFILLPHEQEIPPRDTTNAMAHNQLGFAVLLKFFQFESRFPRHPGEVPKIVIDYIAQQLQLSYEDYRQYDWSGRVIKRHRRWIRDFLGFHQITRQDKQDLKGWLVEQVLPLGLRFEFIREQVSQRLRQLKIEPPASKELDRLINSALRAHEQAFCQMIATQLPPEVCTKMDALLNTESNLDSGEGQFRQSEFSFLKMDPGCLGLNSRLVGK